MHWNLTCITTQNLHIQSATQNPQNLNVWNNTQQADLLTLRGHMLHVIANGVH
jgi:hypothetical protein